MRKVLAGFGLASKSHIRLLPLAKRNKRQHTVIVMNRWTRHRLFILLLGVFVTLSMGLSNVVANTMTLKMPMTSAMASDMGASGKKDCGDCGSTDSKAMICTAGCIASVPVVLGQVEVSATTTVPLLFAPLVFRLKKLLQKK